MDKRSLTKYSIKYFYAYSGKAVKERIKDRHWEQDKYQKANEFKSSYFFEFVKKLSSLIANPKINEVILDIERDEGIIKIVTKEPNAERYYIHILEMERK
jgi:hypothetical protein